MMMRNVPYVFACLGVLAVSTPLFAEDSERTIRKSPFFDGEYDVYDGSKRVGTVRQNPFHSDELNVFDEKGQSQESVHENPFFKDQYDVLDKEGQQTETIQKSFFRWSI
jgi:hypothetical protein